MKLLNFLNPQQVAVPTFTPIEPVVKAVPVTKKVTVEQIHNEFLTAGDRLLKEALTVLEAPPIENENKAKNLHKFGFVQQGLAKEYSNQQNRKAHANVNQEAVLGVRDLYPTHKWITSIIAIDICKKYNLVLGEVNQFTGFVPEKNLNDIAKFFEMYPQEQTRYVSGRSYNKAGWDIFTEEQFKERKEWFENLLTEERQSRWGMGMYPQDTIINICAPLKDIKLRDDEKVENNMIVRETPPDPIVLLQKKSPNGIDGFLIITAWGDEASDPLVVNENNN